MATKKKNTKDHRAKKNMGSAEAYQRERQKKNAERGKQIWDGSKWVRITAG